MQPAGDCASPQRIDLKFLDQAAHRVHVEQAADTAAAKITDIDTPWGLTAFSDIGKDQKWQAAIEALWFFAFYMLIFAAPTALVMILTFDQTVEFDELTAVIIGVVIAYAVYALVLLVRVTQRLVKGRT